MRSARVSEAKIIACECTGILAMYIDSCGMIYSVHPEEAAPNHPEDVLDTLKNN